MSFQVNGLRSEYEQRYPRCGMSGVVATAKDVPQQTDIGSGPERTELGGTDVRDRRTSRSSLILREARIAATRVGVFE